MVCSSLSFFKSHQQPNDENAYLTMKDVFGLTLNANFVTLSACKTGRGKLIKGEGIRGLTHAFMYAGTPAIAVTLWEVYSPSAKNLSIGIFKHLRQPQRIVKSSQQKELKLPNNLAEALRQTKLAMLSGKGKAYESHPYFWAPFVIWGDGAIR